MSTAWADRVKSRLGHDGSGTIELGPDRYGPRRWSEKLETVEAFDHKHEFRAEGALDLSCGRGLWRWSSGVEQHAATPQRSGPLAVGEEPEVADADQAFRQNVNEKAPQELID